MLFETDLPKRKAVVKVIGVGGAGIDVLDVMWSMGAGDMELIAADTDAGELRKSPVANKLPLGLCVCGTNANPNVGLGAAMDSRPQIEAVLKGTDLLFIIAGIGGGTGSGCAPAIAGYAKEMGVPVFAVVIKPFSFEGRVRSMNTERAMEELRENADATAVYAMDKLFGCKDKRLANQASTIDKYIGASVTELVKAVTQPGTINVDMADVKRIMQNKGMAYIAIGTAEGSEGLLTAAERAFHCPFAEGRIETANGVLVNVSTGIQMSLDEFQTLSTLYESIQGDVDFLLGFSESNENDKITVCVMAAGLREN